MKYYNASLNTRLILAFISGAMVFPISFLENINPVLFLDVSLSDVFIGAIFAILVMAPFQKRKNWLKSVLMIIASIAIYTFMVHLAVTKYAMFSLNINYDMGVIISGGFGALLTGVAVQLFAPIKLKSIGYLILIIFGLLAGYVFSHTIDSQSSLINSIGFIIWQGLVCLAMALFKK